jgi:sugar transferase EpsL
MGQLGDRIYFVKRLMDIVFSAVGLLIVSPLIGLLWVLVSMTMGRPVFFRQMRPGLHGRPFQLVKFRTMHNTTDSSGKLLKDGLRMTGLGCFLRAASLDELPSLWSVVRGKMSLVGPRPLLMEYLPLYSPEQARRHEVRPGITGWAQINGRNNLTWEEKFALDLWYVDHQSHWLDLKILFLTVWKVLARQDVASDGHSTMPLFTGTPTDPLSGGPQ